MIVKPQNDNVLCTLVSSNEKQTSTGFVYKSNDILVYRVEAIGPKVGMQLAIGDNIVANSTGTKVVVDNKDYYFFKEENIAGKIDNGYSA